MSRDCAGSKGADRAPVCSRYWAESWLPLTGLSWGCIGAPLVAQTVKNLPPMRETWIQSLGQEDPLENGMATHSGIFA